MQPLCRIMDDISVATLHSYYCHDRDKTDCRVATEFRLSKCMRRALPLGVCINAERN